MQWWYNMSQHKHTVCHASFSCQLIMFDLATCTEAFLRAVVIESANAAERRVITADGNEDNLNKSTWDLG